MPTGNQLPPADVCHIPDYEHSPLAAPKSPDQLFRDLNYSEIPPITIRSGMLRYRLWLIPTDFTMLELRQWHEEHPDDWMPLTVELGHELVELSFRVMETAERLEWYAEAVSGRPPSMN